MKVGIVAEGPGDCGVLVKVLKGAIGVQSRDISFICPELNRDATDRHTMTPAQRSNWLIVLKECQSRKEIRSFIQAPTAGPKLLVVQLDAAECELPNYDVARPAPLDSAMLCRRIELMIVGVMEAEFVDQSCFAVPVEETESWLLPLYSDVEDACLLANPKERFERALLRSNRLSDKDRRQLSGLDEYRRMLELANPLARPRELSIAAGRNFSLKRFVDCLVACGARDAGA